MVDGLDNIPRPMTQSVSPSGKRYADLSTWIRTGIAFSCLFVIGMTVFSVIEGRTNTVISAEKNAANLTVLLDETISNTLQSVETVLELILERDFSSTSPDDRRALHARLKSSTKRLPFIRYIQIYDQSTKVRSFFFDRKLEFSDDVAERPDPLLPSLNPVRGSRLVLGRPYQSPDGTWLLPVANHRYLDPSGAAIVATLDLSEFDRMLKGLDVGRGGIATVFRGDGIILSRHPLDNLTGKSLANGQLFSQYLPAADKGTYHAPSSADFIHRITSYRSLRDLGLVVVTGFSIDAVLAEWLSQSVSDGIVAVGTCVIFIVLGHLLLVEVRRNRSVHDELKRNSDALQATLDNIDQGLLMIDADGFVAVHNRRFNELLDMDENFTSTKPHYTEMRRRLIANAEYSTSDPAFQRWVSDGTLKPVDALYQRVRPNGTVLEVRSVVLPDGGAVRTYSDITTRRRAELDLEASEMRYRLVSENANDLILLATRPRDKRFVSPTVANLLQFTVDEAIELRVQDLVHPDDFEMVRAAMLNLSFDMPQAAIAFRMLRKDGSFVWVESSLKKIVVDEHNFGVVSVIRDITERRTTQLELAAKTDLLQVTLENMDQGLLMVDQQAIVQVCNKRAMELLDLPAELMNRKPHFDEVTAYQFGGNEFAKAHASFSEWVKSGGFERKRHSYERERPNGRILEINTIPIDNGGAVRTYSDITERKADERRITHASRHDFLTDLPNRLLFREKLDQSVAEVKRHGRPFSVLYVDLDRFKAVNDSLGHQAGDKLLQHVTTRLRTSLRTEDTIARLGGDEFAIILNSDDLPEGAAILADRLIGMLQTPFQVDEHSVVIGASIGIALSPENGVEAEQLLRAADLALYRAKASGRNTFRFFQSDMDAEVAARRLLEFDLRQAIKNEELRLVYQPVMSIEEGRMVSCEALLRWRHPVFGEISPGRFIPLAEETGLIIPIGDWVLRQACLTAAGWGGRIGIAVNVSTIQFNSGLSQKVAEALKLSGLPPHLLELEITESVLMLQDNKVLPVLQEIRAMGVRIALDDFGTGYSSLSYLRMFPLDTIKIDQSFIRAIKDPRTSAIIDSIVGLGKRFEVKITAEGVETLEELELVCEKGCTHVQGYLLSHPIPAEQIEPFREGAKLVRAA